MADSPGLWELVPLTTVELTTLVTTLLQVASGEDLEVKTLSWEASARFFKRFLVFFKKIWQQDIILLVLISDMVTLIIPGISWSTQTWWFPKECKMIPLRNKRCIQVLRLVYREFHLSRHQASHSSQWAEANKWGRRRAKRGWSCLTRSSLCGALHALKWHPQINQDFSREKKQWEQTQEEMGLLKLVCSTHCLTNTPSTNKNLIYWQFPCQK